MYFGEVTMIALLHKDTPSKNKFPLYRKIITLYFPAFSQQVASTFIAAILAGAMAQYIAEEIQGPGAEAATKASAEVAKAAQSGDPEAAAKAVVAAAQAVLAGAAEGGKGGRGRVNGRSRLCVII